MNHGEITKEIIVALIHEKVLNDVDSICDAYKKIYSTVDFPLSNPSVN